MDERLNFLFLTEEEAVKAGAGNMERCIEVMDEVFELLGQGDYLMGTPNHNAHGIKIYFPKEPKFPDMPKKGPDRRFMALVAYLGGRFHVCGEKWYGSNIANRDRGLPRSILTTLLNAETCLRNLRLFIGKGESMLSFRENVDFYRDLILYQLFRKHQCILDWHRLVG